MSIRFGCEIFSGVFPIYDQDNNRIGYGYTESAPISKIAWDKLSRKLKLNSVYERISREGRQKLVK